MSEIVIKAKKLKINRGGKKILRGLNFEITKGHITGLIGPSGSGKTTLMRAIIGAQKITSGKLEVLDLPAGCAELLSKIGYVS